MYIYEVMRGHTIVTCTNRNNGNMEKSTRDDTMGGIINNSEWVAGA